jgi:hypothetical protein
MSDEVQLQPDAGEVLQEQGPGAYPLTVLDVRVTEVGAPVRVQQLPTLPGGTRTRNVGSSAPVQLLTPDPYRARVILCAFDQDVLFTFNETSAQEPSSMARQPKGIPLELTARTGLWVMAKTATTDVSVATERWAAGSA